MKCVVGIDLGSTTTKAVLLDEQGTVVGRGITNSRSNYDVACAVAHQEATTAVRFSLLRRSAAELPRPLRDEVLITLPVIERAYRLELYLNELDDLRRTMLARLADHPRRRELRHVLEPAVDEILGTVAREAVPLFLDGERRSSDFFRDIAGAAFMAGAETLAAHGEIPFEMLVALYDRAILEVETRLTPRNTRALLHTAVARLAGRGTLTSSLQRVLDDLVDKASAHPIEEVAFAGTGYGRQTLPFPKPAIKSEILCHGRGAHRVYPNTRTVLDIGGQDTKAIQVDTHGVVTAFQMNDRCAAGCGRYLGYIADELNLGLHELGPLALQATRVVRVCSTCTVFAGAELRERLALGQKREDVLAGLHRAILLRAMSLLARSGGVFNEFTFTGGVCNNPMATQLLHELLVEHYGSGIVLNTDPNSIYMGALGAALFALDDLRAGAPQLLPTFADPAVREEASA